MGEGNDEPRPGFDYFVTHKGQGKYFDTEFNFNGERREVRKGYYTTVVTDIALDWLQRDHGRQAVDDDPRPQGGAQLLHAGAEVRERVRRREGRLSAVGVLSSTTSRTGSSSASTRGTASTDRSSNGARSSLTIGPKP